MTVFRWCQLFSDEVSWAMTLHTRRSWKSQRLLRASITYLHVSFGLMELNSLLLQIELKPAASTYTGLLSTSSTQGTGKCCRIHYSPFYLGFSGWTACHTAKTKAENTE